MRGELDQPLQPYWLRLFSKISTPEAAVSESMSIEEQIQDCREDIKHLEKYQLMYKEKAKAEEDAGRHGQQSWANATANVEAYEKAIERLRDLLVYLRKQREKSTQL